MSEFCDTCINKADCTGDVMASVMISSTARRSPPKIAMGVLSRSGHPNYTDVSVEFVDGEGSQSERITARLGPVVMADYDLVSAKHEIADDVSRNLGECAGGVNECPAFNADTVGRLAAEHLYVRTVDETVDF